MYVSRSYPKLFLSDRLHDAVHAALPKVGQFLMQYGTPNGKGNYLDIATDGQISWRPLSRMEGLETEEQMFEMKGRIKGKPAKTVKGFLGQFASYVDDKEWEIFSNRFLVDHNDTMKLELVDGQDIARFYHEDNMTRLKVVYPLRGSCMRYPSCQPYLELYTQNPNQVQMLVALDSEGDVEARALIWKLDNGETFMDRIYGDNIAIEVFRTYARQHNMPYRKENTYTYPSMMVVDGQPRRRARSVTIEHVPDKFPFCDTMLWLARRDGILANSKTALRGHSNLVKLHSTRGGYSYS